MSDVFKPITGITNNQSLLTNKPVQNNNVQFTDYLNQAINEVVDDVKVAKELSDKLATGEVKDLHQVTIAMEKAELGLQLTVQVRNKIIEAYQEVMRMQL